MNIRVQALVEQARRLPPEEQATLLSVLHELVTPPGPGA